MTIGGGFRLWLPRDCGLDVFHSFTLGDSRLDFDYLSNSVWSIGNRICINAVSWYCNRGQGSGSKPCRRAGRKFLTARSVGQSIQHSEAHRESGMSEWGISGMLACKTHGSIGERKEKRDSGFAQSLHFELGPLVQTRTQHAMTLFIERSALGTASR